LKAINIISFDVPYPANYGGIIDVFYKVKCFYQNGYKVHLHCFEYGKGEQKELNNYCESVSYYKRKTGILSFLSSTPYIVKSRTSEKLKNNLLKNNFPILFEGIHCCALLNETAFKTRFKIVRNHNIEHNYYNGLAAVETNPFKKYYYQSESKKLQRFEPILLEANLCLAISENDLAYLKKKYPNTDALFIPAFHQNETINMKSGKGSYVLYHGNLSVVENYNAAKFLIENIFSDIDIPLKIAGLNPSNDLVNLVSKHKHIELIKNPDNKEMDALIANAQINILYTKQATGLKLKLLNVLYNGRHCIVNSKIVEGTSLGQCCLIEDNPTALKKLISTTFEKEIEATELEKRTKVLSENYSNNNGFEKMMTGVV
jgi:hypothetical protein